MAGDKTKLVKDRAMFPTSSSGSTPFQGYGARPNRQQELYRYLRRVLITYRGWKRRGEVAEKTRLLRKQMGLHKRRGMSPLRVLIEATTTGVDKKQASRWGRALQYVVKKRIKPRDLTLFFGANGGVAGCARHAARVQPKKANGRSDWD